VRPNDDAGRDDRKRLNFANAVSAKFGFLQDLGFSKIESLPTLVRYRNGDIEVSVYHGRNSYEVGFEITNGGTRYSMSELIRATDPAAADKYRNFAATTPVGIEKALTHLEKLAERHAQRALQSDPEFLAALQSQRKSFAQSYALDVLAGQLRPKAAAAFRSGDYREAALLYEKIRSRLSAAELKKLALAKERAGL
jgi:hypothetical protein